MAINSTSAAHLLELPDCCQAPESPFTPDGIGPTEDDISQLWLVPGADVPTAVGILETNAAAAGIGQIFYGPSLETMFNAPGSPNGDSRTPDIIVQPKCWSRIPIPGQNRDQLCRNHAGCTYHPSDPGA